MTDDFNVVVQSPIEVAGIKVATNGRDSSDRDATIAELEFLFAPYIDARTGPIGRVVGSEKEPAGAHQFFIWASEAARSLDVGHIVATFSEDALVIGVVDEPRRYSDLQSFLDDYYDRHLEEELGDEGPTKRPEILVFAVNVLATKHRRDDVDSHRPPVAGKVFYATKEAIAYALDIENFDGEPIAALLHVNGNVQRDSAGQEIRDDRQLPVFQRAPIFIDEDYLVGPEAGHANWTGQSGLATKTSHALFLTSSVFQTLRRQGKNVAALMFNVKGPDLLWLDKPARATSPELKAAYEAADFKGLSERDLAAYAALRLEPEPFNNLHIFAPFKAGLQPKTDHSNAAGIVHLQSISDRTSLNTLRSHKNETGCLQPILFQLGDLLPFPHRLFEYGDLDDKFFGFIAEVRERGVQSLVQLDTLFKEIEDHFAKDPKPDDWYGHHQATIRKARNRFHSLVNKFAGALTDGAVDYGSLPKVDAPFSDQEVRVIDISQCNSNVQELLVSNVINQLWRKAERQELGVEKVIVFVDELNKYAPGGGEGALRNTLVDIAARGRHLNVVLFGAQQFRSKVDDEILGNCGTSFYGRVGDEEIVNSAYRSLSETTKTELLGLRKGNLLVRHAHFRAPLFGSFPMPPTIPGSKGSRVFNGTDGVKVDGEAGRALHMLMRRLMGDRCPRLNEVLNECEGIEDETIVKIIQTVEHTFEQRRGTSAESRVDPWTMARSQIQSKRR
ncbi:MAG: ATP-binding protein [Thermomicrobiales bacterium]